MATMTFEASGCKNCPCLRNTEYGRLTCFFDDNVNVDPWDMDSIPDRCPCVKHDEEK